MNDLSRFAIYVRCPRCYGAIERTWLFIVVNKCLDVEGWHISYILECEMEGIRRYLRPFLVMVI